MTADDQARPLGELLDAVVDDMGGTPRPTQHAMVEAVDQAMRNGEVLLVQAGTGTGKSLAYLLPLYHAAADNGTRAVVATATLALQRQLIAKDLPAIDRTVARLAAGSVTHAVLKGRGNYLCRARLEADPDQDELALDLPTGRLERQAAALRSWAASTATGDRDDYTETLDPRVWRSVSVTGRECVGPSKCDFAETCFSEAARHVAASSHIVVTNHALLALDAVEQNALLPDHDVLVIDEAHELVSRATSAATRELTVAVAERLHTGARSHLSDDVAEQLDEAVSAYAAAVGALDPGTRLRSVPAGLVDPLAGLRDAALLAAGEIQGADDMEVANRHRLGSGLEELHSVAGEILRGDPDDVVWTGAATTPGLLVAPLSVADELAAYLAGHSAAVATSATLTIGGTFAGLAAELGLGDEGQGRWRGIDVGSPFNYPEQGILYIAADLPRPGRDGPEPAVLERMTALITASGGRALVLLSSWRAVDRVGEYLSGVLSDEIPLLVQQRGDPVARLVRRFADEQTSVLVGTMSLFQGVDVPGPACQLVIIDRIPFPHPDDPVLQARTERAQESGVNGFVSVSVPRAALLLAQGAGRLIRSQDDRGVVAVLDSRLATASYSGFLGRSMPPFWPTRDTAVVLSALQRLGSASADDPA